MMSPLNHPDEHKIHISRVPTTFDETVVRRILADHLQIQEDDIHVELIHPRTNENEASAKQPSQPTGDSSNQNNDDDITKFSKSNIKESEPSAHRGFGFITLTKKELYDKIITCSTIKGGRKPTSTKLHTMHIRPYTTSPDETNQCYLWTQGRCPYGNECKFKHNGPGACSVPVAKPADDESKKRGKCFAFKKGKCIKGDACPFTHQVQMPSIQMEEPNTSIPKSERDCLSWKSRGKCSKADNCPYRHDPKYIKKVEEKRKRKREAQEGNTKSSTAPDESGNKKQKQPLCIRVFGMAYDTTPEDIKAFFQDCGKIQRMEFPTFEDSGRSKGYCGIWFSSPKAVEKAVELNGQELLGRWLSVQAGKMYLKEWEANHAHTAQDEQ